MTFLFSFGDHSFRAAGVYYVVFFSQKASSAYIWVIIFKSSTHAPVRAHTNVRAYVEYTRAFRAAGVYYVGFFFHKKHLQPTYGL